MRTENIYSVYVHKNLKNDKYYVGCTSQEPKARWASGWGYKNNTQMWKDIQESNWNTDWVHGILGKFENEKDALKYEAFLIAMLDTIENGYNTSSYSRGTYKRSEVTKRKISDNHAYFRGEKNPLFGKHHSEESRKKMSENRPSKPVLQFSKNGELIAEYPSTREAERQTGCYQSNICACCKGKYKSTGGYIWRYKE